jgi:hypothetical protein
MSQFSTSSKPLFPQPGMTRTQRHRCSARYLDATLKATNALLRRTGWKRNSAWIFRVAAEIYLTALVRADLGPEAQGPQSIGFTMGVKPMRADDMYWEIAGLPENRMRPPSFRSNAAIKARALDVRQVSVDGPHDDPEASAARLVAAIRRTGDEVLADLSGKSFADYLAAHPEGKNLHALLWSCLIAEGREDEAGELIEAYFAAADRIGEDGNLIPMAQNPWRDYVWKRPRS